MYFVLRMIATNVSPTHSKKESTQVPMSALRPPNESRGPQIVIDSAVGLCFFFFSVLSEAPCQKTVPTFSDGLTVDFLKPHHFTPQSDSEHKIEL